MSTAILAPGSRGRRLSKRLLQVVITLFGLLHILPAERETRDQR